MVISEENCAAPAEEKEWRRRTWSKRMVSIVAMVALAILLRGPLPRAFERKEKCVDSVVRRESNSAVGGSEAEDEVEDEEMSVAHGLMRVYAIKV